MRIGRNSTQDAKSKTKPPRKRVSEELIQVIHLRVNALAQENDDFSNLDGLEELVQHSVNGLSDIGHKRMTQFDEMLACRQHLHNLKTTMTHMSNISRMTEMHLLMAALTEILEAASVRLGELERSAMH